MNSGSIIKVAINVPLSREFDYRPIEGQQSAEPGSRVIVPYGRRRQVGIVMEVAAQSDLPDGKLRQCIAAPDDGALLSAEDLKLLRFTAEYSHHPIGEVAAWPRRGGKVHSLVATPARNRPPEARPPAAPGGRAPPRPGALTRAPPRAAPPIQPPPRPRERGGSKKQPSGGG